MSIPILIEPAAHGFRAVTGGPLNLTAEAESAAAAVSALRAKIADRLNTGAIIVEQSISDVVSPVPVLPLAENPLFDDWLAAVEAYREQKEREECATEAS